MNKVCIIGKNGFIGGALARRMQGIGYAITSVPSKESKMIFDFGSPVHPPFEENPDFYMTTLLPRHLAILRLGVPYIYASSALVYENKEIPFTYFKKALEDLAMAYPETPSMGLRIFPVYGPGEDRTFIAQACKAMKAGDSPVIYGNGSQTRDFVFIDDVVDQILVKALLEERGIYDIGTGIQTSFNKIVEAINKILGTDIQPTYADLPAKYALESPKCKIPIFNPTSLYDGCKRILEQ